jgi:hypothetical protein
MMRQHYCIIGDEAHPLECCNISMGTLELLRVNRHHASRVRTSDKFNKYCHYQLRLILLYRPAVEGTER